MMSRFSLVLPLAVLVTQSGCAPPALISDLGTDPTYAPRIAAVDVQRSIARRVTVTLPKAAFVTVVEVEDGPAAKVLLRFATADQTLKPFPAGTHRLTLQPARSARDTVNRDPAADVLASMGKPPGGESTIVGVGSPPLKPCPATDPTAPTYCPVPATDPIYDARPVPPDHYLICIAQVDPVGGTELRARLRQVNLTLRGRELVSEIAAAASGNETAGHWAAVALRR